MQVLHQFLISKGTLSSSFHSHFYFCVKFRQAKLYSALCIQYVYCEIGYFTEDVQEFKQFLWNKWFARWSVYVPGVVASSGWEHTYLGESGSDEILYGFESWIQVYNEEEYGHLNYLGYIEVIETESTTVLSLPILLNGNHVSYKPFSNLNVGVSPELELALGTLCYITRDGVDEPCVFQTSDAIEYAMDVHSIDYNGVNYIENSHTTFGEEED